ncbi:MAG: hypothetical protein ABIM50_00905 [Novosphingobium sp.]
MKFARIIAALTLAASLALPAALSAKTATTPDSTAMPNSEEARDALNRKQAEAAQRQVGENVAREENYAAAVTARAATIKRQQEAYAASIAAYAAQKAQYEADLARWRASLPKCKSTRRHPCPAI